MSGARPTRERIVDEAMRLFGERGYAATSVADIEAAAGLAAGGGGLYRHFRSKRELLEAGVRRQVAANRALLDRLTEALARQGDLEEQLRELGRAGVARLEQERDLNRLVVRDLRQFPDLLATAADEDIRPVHEALAGWLARRDVDGVLDAPAVAAVLAGATSHYWLLSDVFGEHPSGVDVQRYVAALAGLVAAALRNRPQG
jgi:AcrR family transcriptional regulator